MIDSLLKNVTLTAAENKLITTVRTRTAELNDIISKAAAEHHNRSVNGAPFTHLMNERDRVLAELAENPSSDLAEQAHHAILRCEDAARSAGSIAGAVGQAVARENAKLAPITARIITAARTDLEARRKASAAAIESAEDVLGLDAGAIHSRALALDAELLSERELAQRAPLVWLAQHELLPPA